MSMALGRTSPTEKSVLYKAMTGTQWFLATSHSPKKTVQVWIHFRHTDSFKTFTCELWGTLAAEVIVSKICIASIIQTWSKIQQGIWFLTASHSNWTETLYILMSNLLIADAIFTSQVLTLAVYQL